MKTRSLQEIQDLDEDLHLFDEDNWDFFAVVDTKEENYEYFNDIRDSDFIKTKKPSMGLVLAGCMVGFLAVSSAILVKLYSDHDDLDRVQNIASVNGTANVDYVVGEQASSEELIQASQLLNSYQNKLMSDLSGLTNYVDGGSSVGFEYTNALEGIQVMYDSSDIYARVLKEFATRTRINRVNQLIIKDGKYYCYAEVSCPSTMDVYEYIYLYSYNLTKFAMTNDLTEESLGKYFIDSLNDNSLPVTSTETLIMLNKSGDSFMIAGDSWLKDIYVADYQQAITQMTSMLSENLTVGGF